MEEKKSVSLLCLQEEVEKVLANSSLDSIFARVSGHPPILKKYLNGDLSIETLVILDKILGFRSNFDKKVARPGGGNP